MCHRQTPPSMSLARVWRRSAALAQCDRRRQRRRSEATSDHACPSVQNKQMYVDHQTTIKQQSGLRTRVHCAPAASNRRAMCRCARNAATCSAVRPLSSAASTTMASTSSNSLTQLSLPCAAAMCKGREPSRDARFASAPSASRRFVTRVRPLRHAVCSCVDTVDERKHDRSKTKNETKLRAVIVTHRRLA